MPNFYTVIQFIPDEVADERVNIGVAVISNGIVRTHFVDNWVRVRQMAGRDIDFVRDFEKDAARMSEAAIRRAIDTWMHSIQFSELAPSRLAAESLMLYVAKRFLVDPSRSSRGYRLRGEAVRIARREVKQTLVNRLGGLGKLYLKEEKDQIFGARSPHPFDVSVGNGEPFFIAQAISFEVPDVSKVSREVDAAAWAIKDVREAHPGLPLSVIALSSQAVNDLYRRATDTFQELGAEVVPENQVKIWADRMVDGNLPQSAYDTD